MTNTISAHLDAEIAKARKQASDRIAKLKREAAAEQKKIDAKVIELLREQEPELHERLARQAMETLATARTKGANGLRIRPVSTTPSGPLGNDVARGISGTEA